MNYCNLISTLSINYGENTDSVMLQRTLCLLKCVCLRSLCTYMSLVIYLFDSFLFPSLIRALTPCGKTSVPRPQNCTLNSGEKWFHSTVGNKKENTCVILTDSFMQSRCNEHVPMCLQDHNSGSGGLFRCLSEGGRHGYQL